jgi:DNA-binding transcriptional LysR family regulator
MDTNAIKCFIRCYEEQSINKAAKQLFITPQGLSKIIHNLEEEFHVKLFVRSSKGIHPTESGNYFYQHCNDLLLKLEEIEINMHRLQEQNKKIRIGFSCGVLQAIPFNSINAYKKKHPELHLVFEEGLNKEIKQKLRQGKFDLGIVVGRVASNTMIEHELFSTQLYAIIYEGHPLYKKNSISITDLKGEPMITLNEQYQCHFSFIQRCQDFGFLPQIVMKTIESQLIYQLCSQELGIGIDIKIHTNASKFSNLRYVPITDSIPWTIYMVYPKDHLYSDNLEHVVSFFLNTISKNS